MSIKDRYTIDDGASPRWGAIARDGVILLAVLVLIPKLWPFYSVPTGSRGVVTQFGKIVGRLRRRKPMRSRPRPTAMPMPT